MGDNAVVQQQEDGPPKTALDNSCEPADDEGPIHGEYDARSRPTSFYTRTFEWYPALKPLALGGVALGAFALLRHPGGNGHHHPVRDAGHRLADAAKSTTKHLT